MNGFLMISRDLLESPVFANEKLLKVYIYLLAKARYKDGHTWLPVTTGKGKSEIKICKGQAIIGKLTASEQTGFPPSTFDRLVKKLVDFEFIYAKKTAHYTLVTVRQLSENDSFVMSSEQPMNNQRTTNGQPMDNQRAQTNKEKKEEKEYKDNKLKEEGSDFNKSQPTPKNFDFENQIEESEIEELKKIDLNRQESETSFAKKKEKSSAKKERKADPLEMAKKLLTPDQMNDPQIMELWGVLCAMPKWRKKTEQAIAMSLKQAAKYNVEFVVAQLQAAIAGEWQGLFFSDTEKKYQEFINKSNTSKNGFKTKQQQVDDEFNAFAERMADFARETRAQHGFGDAESWGV